MGASRSSHHPVGRQGPVSDVPPVASERVRVVVALVVGGCGAAVASLVGVALAVVKAKSQSSALAATLTTTGVVTVFLSWALVHTLYVMRYARLHSSSP